MGGRCSRWPLSRCSRFRCWCWRQRSVAYPLSFLVQMVSVDAGFRLATAYADMVRYAFAPAALPTVDSATGDAVLCGRVSACWPCRRLAGSGPTSSQGKAQPRSRPMVGAHRRRAVERRAGTAPFSRVAVASVPRTRHCERAAAGRSEPPLHRAAVREPRPARISRAHHRDARRGDTRRPRVRGDWRGAAAGILSARARRSDRSERRRAQPGLRRACGGAVRAGADRAAPHRVLARELLERRGASHRAIGSARWRDCSRSWRRQASSR